MNPLKLLSTTYKYRKWLSKGFAGLIFILAGIIALVYRAEIETFQLLAALLLWNRYSFVFFVSER